MSMIANLLALALIAADGPPANPSAMPKIARPHDGNPEPLELWNLTLREAIRLGLENSEVIRVISLGFSGVGGGFEPVPTPLTDPANPSDITIAPLNRDASIWNFQAEVMAHVRSVEQLYWSLWSLQAALEAREAAVKEGEKALARERAEMEVVHGSAVDIAEAEQQLETFKLDLVSVTSDLITAERQFRNILGLPTADGRRIIAATPPMRAKVAPNWESSRRAMLGSNPEIVQQRVIDRLFELRLLLARNQLLPPLRPEERRQVEELGQVSPEVDATVSTILGRPVPQPDPAPQTRTDPVPKAETWESGGRFSMPIGIRAPLANIRQAQYRLLQQRAALRQAIDQLTETLGRFFGAIEAEHDQFEAARRHTEEAGRRLEAQRAFFEEGRITIDRLFDAIARHADAVAAEAEHLAEYNTAIAAFEESKGTLLAHEAIAIADRPRSRQAYVQAKDREVAPASFDKLPEAPEPVPAPAAPAPAGRTFKLKAKLGPGGLDLDIEVHEAAGGRAR